jgi:hypothetical protein
MTIQEPRILCLFAAPLVGPHGTPLAVLDTQRAFLAILCG